MKRKIILAGVLVIFVIMAAIALYFCVDFYRDRELRKAIKQATSDTVMVDINLHHNQVLDAAEHITASGKIKVPNILINFDTHSDYYFSISPSPRYQESIAAWVNGFIATYEIDTVYWVMPDEEAKAEHTKKYMASIYNEERGAKYSGYGNTMNDKLPEDYFYKHPIEREPFVQNCILDTHTATLIEDIEDAPLFKELYKKDHEYRKVKLITVTMDSLPDLGGADVFLSIDGDYFSNNGYDTHGNLTFVKSKKEIRQKFCELFKTLKKKHINPTMITMSLSPPYLPKNRHRLVVGLFKRVCRYSGIKDLIDIYSRTWVAPTNAPADEMPPQDGMPPMDGMPPNAMPPYGMPQNGMPPNGMPQNGMPPMQQ